MSLTLSHTLYISGSRSQRQRNSEIKAAEMVLLALKEKLPCCRQGHKAGIGLKGVPGSSNKKQGT